MAAVNKEKVSRWKKYFPLIHELVLRDIKVKYRRSFLGYLWSLLNPLLMMLVMTAVLSHIFRFDIENYPLYLITGQTLWSFFNESTNMAMYSIIQNAPLLKKVYIPKFIFPLSRVISSFVTMLFSLVAIVLVMLFTRSPIYWTLLLFFVPLLLLLLFCVGMGMILSSLSVYFRDITHLYGVLCLAWMYATPIFYPLEQLSDKMQYLMHFNPMFQYIDCFRSLVLYGQLPSGTTLLACFLASFGSLVIGLLVFNRLQRNFVTQI